MRLFSFAVAVVSIAAMLGVASPASAGPIVVVNPSFEILPAGGLPFAGCGAGCSYSDDDIPGWTGTGFLGQFQPGSVAGNFTYFNYVPDGITVAYTVSGGPISQTLSAIAQAGVTYTLQVDIGFRNDAPGLGSAILDINGNLVVATGAGVQFSGNWATYTAVYTATALDDGGPISIILATTGQQGDWDNVRLSASNVPEPSALALIAASLLLLFGLSWMRRRTDA